MLSKSFLAYSPNDVVNVFFIFSTYVWTVLPLTAFSSVAFTSPLAFTFRSYVLFLLLLVVLSVIVTLLSLEFNVTSSNLFVISFFVANVAFSLLYVVTSNFLSNSVFNCPPFIASFESAVILPSSSPVIFLLTVISFSFNVILVPFFPFSIDVIPVNSFFKLNLTTPLSPTSAFVLVPPLKLNPFVNVVSFLDVVVSSPLVAVYFIFWLPTVASVTIGDAVVSVSYTHLTLPTTERV